MKPAIYLLSALLAAHVNADSVSSLKDWKIEGVIEMDASKPGPDGQPSIKIEPRSRGALQLRESDGSGKVSFYVYDDGKVASPNKQHAVGPRWGLTESNGRVLVGGLAYARYLQPDGSQIWFDTHPEGEAPWREIKFLGPRGKPGWQKWEFDYNPDKGLAIKIDGQPVSHRYFDWNTTKAYGFNGIVFYGDESPVANEQTIWVSDIQYDLGPAMKVTPGNAPPLPAPPLAAAQGPAPEELTEKSTEPPVIGRMDGFVPGPTLLDDLKNLKIPLVEGYASQHPRLLFYADDRAALQERALAHPELWNAVIANANWIVPERTVPEPQVIISGSKYWRIEKVQSAALAWFVTGEDKYSEAATRWMVAHCKQPLWGDSFRPNLDLIASWYLYHIAIGYDILKNEMSPEDAEIIRQGLTEHARHLYVELDPYKDRQRSYDQNHTYIPSVALSSAALALLDDVPEAKYWLTRSYAALRRSRYVLGDDGYYYEGIGYWTYALNWHARGAELLARATGENLYELPALRDTWKFGLYFSLPGKPGAFAMGDTPSWANGELQDMRFNNYALLWKIGAETGTPESSMLADIFLEKQLDQDYPATAFLWFNPLGKTASKDQIPPYHYFADHGVVSWRSGWGADATAYLFRCGPAEGHQALEKLNHFKDWRMNYGHVHPDIGGFWMFAKGAYLAVDTGYTAEKWTRDHNTLIVDDVGQGIDGSYHNGHGAPYENFADTRITSQYLSPDYGYASGEFGSAYRRKIKDLELHRSLLMTQRWMLIVDDMQAKEPHRLTWLCHSIGEFQKVGEAYVSAQPGVSLAVIPLSAEKLVVETEPTMVAAGISPTKKWDEQRGHKLKQRSPEPVTQTRFINLLLPLDAHEPAPAVQLTQAEGDVLAMNITWANGTVENVRLDLDWEAKKMAEPAQISMP